MHAVYCLKKVDGESNRRKTYVGYTANLARRIRQHNGEISGGAKSTRGAKWQVFYYVDGFPDERTALSCEKRFHRLKTSNRTAGIIKVLSEAVWKRRGKGDDIVPSDLDLTLHCDPRDFEKLLPLPGNLRMRDLCE